MENGSSPAGADDIHVLQNRVLELERRLAEAQAATLVGAVSKDNGTLRRFEQLFAHSRDIILFIRPDDGQILGANAPAIQAYGYSHAELRALTIHALCAPDTQAPVAGQMAIADTEGILLETTHRRKDGSFFPVEVSSHLASIDGGPILVSVVRDITERARLMAELQHEKSEAQQRAEALRVTKKALREARDQAAWLARLPGENPNPVVRVSATGKILYHNPAAAQLPGWTCAVDRPLSPTILPLVEQAMAQRQEVQQDIPLGGRVYLISVMPLPGEGYANLYGRDITERKQAEEALRESEQRYSALFHAKTNGIAHCRVITDAQGQPVDYEILQVNTAYEQITGIERAAIEGRRAREVFPGIENYVYDYIGNYGRVALEGGELNFEVFFEATRQWLSIYIYSPKPGEFTAIFSDISQRKQVEEALRESEERFRVAVKNTPSVYAQTDRDLRYRWIHNPHSDFRAEDVIGKRDDELSDTEDIHRLVALKRQVLESGIGLREELVFYRSDGVHAYDMTIEPLRDRTNQIVGVSTAALDITESKRAQEALRLSEARLRRLVEANIIGVVTRDTTGQITDANDAFLKLVGYSIEELRAGQLDIFKLLPEDYRHLEKQIVEEVLTSGESQPYEKEYIRQDGQRVPVLVGYARQEGLPDQLIGFVLDLTELKQAQTALSDHAEKLKRSNQELEQFAFVASHDLQEPLRKIIRFGDSLSERLKPDMGEKTAAEAGDYLRRMQNAAERMRAMIEGLLDLSRVSRQGKAFEIVDLAHIALEVISDLEPRILHARGQVQLGTMPKIEADPLQMHQLIQNLIANALKFHKAETPPVVIVHSKVIRTKQNDPGCVVLQVEDNGIGFDEQDAGRIFQPFQRLHGRGEYEGTGMGLAICQKIVERHHGTITVRSQPGVGAAFMIELPLRQPA